MWRRGGAIAFAGAPMPMMAVQNSPPEMAEMARPDTLKAVTKIRKIFPETWLWQNETLG